MGQGAKAPAGDAVEDVVAMVSGAVWVLDSAGPELVLVVEVEEELVDPMARNLSALATLQSVPAA